jgi:drug/metabolite transporter (DMT)-like permease
MAAAQADEMNQKGQVLTLLILLNALWAPVNFMVVTARQDLSVSAIALIRWSLVSGLLFLLLGNGWFRAQTHAKWPEAADRWKAIAIGATMFAPAHLLYYSALNRTTTIEGTVLSASGPIWAGLLAWLILGERVPKLRWLAIVVGCVGAYVVSVGFGLPQWQRSSTVGNALYLTGVVVESLGIVLASQLVRKSSGITVLSYQTLGSVLTFALVPILTVDFPLEVRGASLSTIGSMSYLVLLPGLFCFAVWYRMVERVPLSLMVVTLLMQPPFAAWIGWMFLGETLTSSLALGTTLIVSALMIAALGRSASAASNLKVSNHQADQNDR